MTADREVPSLLFYRSVLSYRPNGVVYAQDFLRTPLGLHWSDANSMRKVSSENLGEQSGATTSLTSSLLLFAALGDPGMLKSPHACIITPSVGRKRRSEHACMCDACR